MGCSSSSDAGGMEPVRTRPRTATAMEATAARESRGHGAALTDTPVPSPHVPDPTTPPSEPPARIIRRDVSASRKKRGPRPPATQEAAVLRQRPAARQTGLMSTSAASYDARYLRAPHANVQGLPPLAPVRRARSSQDLRLSLSSGSNLSAASGGDPPPFDERAAAAIEAQLDAAMLCITGERCRE